VVEDLAKKLRTFSDLLGVVSGAVERIELSNALRQERPPELSLIRSSIEHSRKAMRTLVTCLGKLGMPKSHSALKNAIRYWCYEHDGKSIIDKALKDINEQISIMNIAFQSVCVYVLSRLSAENETFPCNIISCLPSIDISQLMYAMH
jgi:hypothetical protein